MAFFNAFNMALTLKHELKRMLSFTVELSMLTDSLKLFDDLTRSSTGTEKI